MNEFVLLNQIDKFKKFGYDFTNIGNLANYESLRKLYETIQNESTILKLDLLQKVCEDESAPDYNKSDFLDKIASGKFAIHELKDLEVIAHSVVPINIIENWFGYNRIDLYKKFYMSGYPLDIIKDMDFPTKICEKAYKLYECKCNPFDYIPIDKDFKKTSFITSQKVINNINLKEYKDDFNLEQLQIICKIKEAQSAGLDIDPGIINKDFSAAKMEILLWACENYVDLEKFLHLDDTNTSEINILETCIFETAANKDLQKIFNNVNEDKIILIANLFSIFSDYIYKNDSFNNAHETYAAYKKKSNPIDVLIDLVNKYDANKAAALFNLYANNIDYKEYENETNSEKLILETELLLNLKEKINLPDGEFENLYYCSLALLYNKENNKVYIDPNIFLSIPKEECKNKFVEILKSTFTVIAGSKAYIDSIHYYDGPTDIEYKDGTHINIEVQEDWPDFDIFGSQDFEKVFDNFCSKYRRELNFLIMANLVPKLGQTECYKFNNNVLTYDGYGFTPLSNIINRADNVYNDCLERLGYSEISYYSCIEDILKSNGLNIDDYLPNREVYSIDGPLCYCYEDILNEYGAVNEKTIECANRLFMDQCRLYQAYYDNCLYEIRVEKDGNVEWFGNFFAEDIDDFLAKEYPVINLEEER